MSEYGADEPSHRAMKSCSTCLKASAFLSSQNHLSAYFSFSFSVRLSALTSAGLTFSSGTFNSDFSVNIPHFHGPASIHQRGQRTSRAHSVDSSFDASTYLKRLLGLSIHSSYDLADVYFLATPASYCIVQLFTPACVIDFPPTLALLFFSSLTESSFA